MCAVAAEAQDAGRGQVLFANRHDQPRDIDTGDGAIGSDGNGRWACPRLLSAAARTKFVPAGAEAQGAMTVRMPKNDPLLVLQHPLDGAVLDVGAIDAGVGRRVAGRPDQDVLRILRQVVNDDMLDVFPGMPSRWPLATKEPRRCAQFFVEQWSTLAAVPIDGDQPNLEAMRKHPPMWFPRFPAGVDEHRTHDAMVGRPVAGIKELPARVGLQDDRWRTAGEFNDRRRTLAVAIDHRHHATSRRRHAHMLHGWRFAVSLGLREFNGAGSRRSQA